MGDYIILHSKDLVEEFVEKKKQEFQDLFQKNLSDLDKFKRKLNLPDNQTITIECRYINKQIPSFELGMLDEYCEFVNEKKKKKEIKEEKIDYKSISLDTSLVLLAWNSK